MPDSCVPPEVAPELEPFLHHFWELSTSRGVGFSTLLSIPWQIIDQYAIRHGYADDELDYADFMYYIRALDEAFLTATREGADKKKKPEREGAKKPARRK